jgi:hypothetical protein
MTDAELGATTDRRVEQLVDAHMAEVTTVPHGRKGLWLALAVSLTPRIAERSLPDVELAMLRSESTSMFDYELDDAVRLDLTVDPGLN